MRSGRCGLRLWVVPMQPGMSETGRQSLSQWRREDCRADQPVVREGIDLIGQSVGREPPVHSGRVGNPGERHKGIFLYLKQAFRGIKDATACLMRLVQDFTENLVTNGRSGASTAAHQSVTKNPQDRTLPTLEHLTRLRAPSVLAGARLRPTIQPGWAMGKSRILGSRFSPLAGTRGVPTATEAAGPTAPPHPACQYRFI